MLQLLSLVTLCLTAAQAQVIHLRLQEPQELPAFRTQVFYTSRNDPLPSMSSPMGTLFGMSRAADGDWDSWMDSQFDALNAMNSALMHPMGRRGGCGHHRMQEDLAPVIVRGVPTMTTPSAVMQRLASARFGSDLLRALIEDQMASEGSWAEEEQLSASTGNDELEGLRMLSTDVIDIPQAFIASDPMLMEDEDVPELNREMEALMDNERLLDEADLDEEAEAEADATEQDVNAWTSLLPSWVASPENEETDEDSAPVDSINWSLKNDDGSWNWGFIIFLAQTTACVSVWAGVCATLGYYNCCRRGLSKLRRRQQFATSADSHLVTPLMYESIAKDDQTSQLYGELYPVEDAKLHADDKTYAGLQYVPLKTDV